MIKHHNYRIPQKRPQVAVVITCYNQGVFLARAIQSVLEQTVQAAEVVVVNDGSSDDTVAVATRAGVRCVSQTNQGLAAARNRGVAEVDSDCVIFLDADDRLRPRAIESGINCLMDNPDSAFVSGRFARMNEAGVTLNESASLTEIDDWYHALLRGGNLITMHATVMYRQRVLEEAGGFDNSLRACDEYDLYLRLTRRYPVAAHADIVGEYRVHGSNMSHDHQRMIDAALRILASQRRILEADGDREALAALDAGVLAWRANYGASFLMESAELIRRPGTRVAGLRSLVRFFACVQTRALPRSLSLVRSRLSAKQQRA